MTFKVRLNQYLKCAECRFKYCITFLALSVSGNALATLIDFEDVITPAGNHIIVNSVTTDGFILSRDGTGHIDVGSATEIDYANNGTQVAFVHNGSFTLNLHSVLGDTFEINSFLGAEFWRDGQLNATKITLTAVTSSGANLNEVFTLDNLFDGPSGVQDFQQFTVSSAFQDLVSAKFVGDAAFSIDDIYGLTATEKVLEPSTMAIFALGIMGLSFRRFKKIK